MTIAPCIVQLVAFFVLMSIGCGILAAARLPVSRRSVLLAPALGTAALTVASMTLGTLGVPAHSHAAVLIAALVLGSAVVLRNKLAAVVRALPPLSLAAVVAASVFIAAPSFVYGFSWVGLANEDMTRTAMAAEFWRTHGLTEGPRESDLIWNRNITSSELGDTGTLQAGTPALMAMFMEATGIGTFQAMMPVVIVAFMCLLAAMGAMMPWRLRDRWVAPAILALATSGLVVYTTVNQGADEILGLALFCGYAAVLPALWRPRASRSWYIIAALLLAGLFELYVPLTILAVLLTAAHAFLHVRRRRLAPTLIRAALGAAAGALFLNAYLHNFAITATSMLKSGSGPIEHGAGIKFIAFFIPPGFAYLWGLLPLSSYPPEPAMSAVILFGMALTAVIAVLSVQRARRGNAPALMTVIVLLFSLYFFVRMADYALYKSASYVQPFAICATVASLERLGAARTVPRARRWQLAAMLAIGFALSLWTSGFYVRRSLDAIGDVNATFINGRFLTTQRIVDRLQSTIRRSRADVVISNATELNIERIMADAVPDKSVFFPTTNRVEHHQPSLALDYIAWRPIGVISLGRGATNVAGFAVENRRAAPQFSGSARDYLIVGPRYNVFNRAAPWHQDPFFSLLHEADVTNALAYVDSTAGVAELGDPHNTLSTLERDYFAPQETYAGVGRYLIFEVLRPSKPLHLLIDFTTMGFDAVRPLPPVSVIGKRRYAFPLVGGGSARVLSPPIEPYVTRGHAFVCLDMGREGTLRHYPRRGLLALFGRNLPLDERRLVAYLRDLSAVSGVRTPGVAALEDVPRDLRTSGVLYSGIYDDGWLGSRSYVKLTARRSGQHLRLKGFVPLIGRGDFDTRLVVRVDGRVVADQDVLPGEFTVEPPDPLRAGRHDIALEFSAVQTLPGDDGRHVGGALTSIGISD